MSDRPRGDPGWAWYEREVARLEAALAEEREKSERLRTAGKRLANSDIFRAAHSYTAAVCPHCEFRATLASTGSEDDG